MKLADSSDCVQPILLAWTERSTRRAVYGGRLALPLIAYLFLALAVHAQQSKPSEYDVKAAYLYNFGRFVDWPAAADQGDSFAFCVLGRDPFGPALDAILAGQTVNGKRAVAKRISRAEDAANCRVLFISSSEDNQLGNIVAALDKIVVLTVSDIRQFSQRGGMIQFVSDGNRVHFEVNLTNASNVGLTLSSDLLKVATTVRRSTPSGD